MGSVSRDIFKAIHEQKWLAVEYRNKQNQVTRYWIGINSFDPQSRTLGVDGLHLHNYQQRELTLRMDGIVSTSLVEGSFHRTPMRLREAIEEDERYEKVFGAVPNLKVLDYLYDCARLNQTPYVKDFALISRVDDQSFQRGAIRLDDEQFSQMVRLLQGDASKDRRGSLSSKQIAINMLSVHTRQGLYVLAYREMRLDVKRRSLAIGKNVLLCREFLVVNGRAKETHSISRYLDESGLLLLDDFETNAEAIRNAVTEHCRGMAKVDDVPHVFSIQRNAPQYLHGEYDAISAMFESDNKPTYPIQAFFGNLVRRPFRRKEYPLSLVNQQANLDQLLAINQALKYPLTYVQGPPGTGKTSTIVNTIVNAYCNGQTVLFASYNNHPVDGVFAQLTSLVCDDRAIPFPILRLGNQGMVAKALDYIKDLYTQTENLNVPRVAPRLGNGESTERAKTLTALLKEYEEQVDLRERRECVQMLAATNDNLNFTVELESKQLAEINQRLGTMPDLDDLFEQSRQLTADDHGALMRFLLGASAFRIQQLGKPRYAELFDIVMSDAPVDERVKRFNKYVSVGKNLRMLQRVFPVIATTCISARLLGPAQPSFDITIIDEASQCDTATALVPILRGNNLVLVGDPQQLNPVVMLDKSDNMALRRAYQVGDEYDYLQNSVYKTFLACDSVSNEILLHAHYRCDERIIGFNNKKYYGSRLQIKSGRRLPEALEFIDIEYDNSPIKNAAPSEADAIVRYAQEHPDLSIGVITPFANQRDMIRQTLDRHGVSNATCGTVHAYQGDEKDVILFSLALTSRTTPGTYKWLTQNRELINVATSRARDKLVVLSSSSELERLHATQEGTDDIYELATYVGSNGATHVTPREVSSRALGVKPYSTKTEEEFLQTLNHALGTIFVAGTKHVVKHEIPIAAVFEEDVPYESLFFSGRFDFVVYEVQPGKVQVPVLAIELDGKEHVSDEVVRRRDRQKEAICARHGFQLIRVENSYARRYHYVKEILVDYFEGK